MDDEKALVERAQQALKTCRLVLSVSLDYVEKVPDLEFAREDLQDAAYDLQLALANGDVAIVRQYVEECDALLKCIHALFNQKG